MDKLIPDNNEEPSDLLESFKKYMYKKYLKILNLTWFKTKKQKKDDEVNDTKFFRTSEKSDYTE